MTLEELAMRIDSCADQIAGARADIRTQAGLAKDIRDLTEAIQDLSNAVLDAHERIRKLELGRQTVPNLNGGAE